MKGIINTGMFIDTLRCPFNFNVSERSPALLKGNEGIEASPVTLAALFLEGRKSMFYKIVDFLSNFIVRCHILIYCHVFR